MDKTFVSDYIKIIPSRLLENQPNEICSHWSVKASKGRLLGPDKLQNHTNKRKGKEKKKERGGRKEVTREKTMVAFLVFKMTPLEIVVGR